MLSRAATTPPGRQTRRISPQRGHRVGQVLEHLVGVDDVEGAVGVVERVDVADGQLQVRRRRVGSRRLAGGVDHVGRRIDAHHAAWRDARGDVDGDGARPAAHVEHVGAGHQVGRRR